MDAWKILICRGNRCFEQALLTEAAGCYQAALAEAQRCVSEHERSEDAAGADELAAGAGCRFHEALAAVAAYVVTRHNLADLSLRLDDPEEAAGHLLAAHERLTQIIEDPSLPWPLRCAAMRNSARTREAVLSFADQHGEAGATCAIERRITRITPMPTSTALH